MSKFNKLIQRIYNLADNLRFEELSKVLESFGYEKRNSGSGGSHYTFRKEGKPSITIPKNKRIKRVYIEKVKEIVEGELNNDN